MPTKIERDAVTGKTTTGHEWDGIKELEHAAAEVVAVRALRHHRLVARCGGCSIRAGRGSRGYFGGILGANQRLELVERMAAAEAARAQYLERIGTALARPDRAGSGARSTSRWSAGGAAFADNCAPCHGLGGAGQGFYPNLADDAWIWGGTLDDIHTTILYGIRSGHARDPAHTRCRRSARSTC